MATMLALRAHQGAEALVLDEVPVPEPGPLDVVVKVAAAGLAPGIMRLLRMGALKHLPTTLGHEAAGVISAVGRDVTGHAVGDRARVHPLLNCQECDYCRTDRDMMCAQQAMIGHAAFGDAPMPLYEQYHDGGLAEYVRVPHWLIDSLPDSVGFDVAAKIQDLANAVRALKCADLPERATLVVTAATGTMGTATVKLAEHFGVARLILVGRDTDRLHRVAGLSGGIPASVVALGELPENWSTDGSLTRRLRELAPEGAHAVIDFIPEGPALGQTMAGLGTGGTLVHMGGNTTPLALPPIALMMHCWRFVATRAYTRQDATDVLRLLAAGTLTADELITHRFPLTEALRAMDAIQQRVDAPMWMTVINP
ncbi:theronine dehydrogenase [Streptomyces canus]|uniref:2-deoxy-scyllo-inosamine dehydrogenase n=1 Tax=Streptomyces canus TaxID=58343 RepID=A0A101SIA1_9ACTN|nr:MULTISPECIES: alcohol dehydrogenase catalytic domain-containing protein [Streptomyces]KUN74344.1 theronine dehydrogenase [Streptomyces canus]MDI5904934.1 alcohol dehydrogenase catalytic domain-containing protein [Streptomyces sp. 12257]